MYNKIYSKLKNMLFKGNPLDFIHFNRRATLLLGLDWIYSDAVVANSYCFPSSIINER